MSNITKDKHIGLKIMNEILYLMKEKAIMAYKPGVCYLNFNMQIIYTQT